MPRIEKSAKNREPVARDRRIAAAVAYTGIGLIYTYLKRGRDPFILLHLNQAFGIVVLWVAMAVLGQWEQFALWTGYVSLVLDILALAGMVCAFRGWREPIPFLGKIRILKPQEE